MERGLPLDALLLGALNKFYKVFLFFFVFCLPLGALLLGVLTKFYQFCFSFE